MDKTYIRNSVLASAGLAINGAGLLVPKTTNTVASKIDGNIIAAVAAGALPALTGFNVPLLSTHAVTVVVSTAGVYSYVQANRTVDVNGVATYVPLLNTAITTGIYPTGLLAPHAQGTAVVGYIIVKTTAGATFTGGTTALDAANITVTYIDGNLAAL
jgi:hypothetical protein